MQATTPEVDVEHLADAVRTGAAIVDVREPREYLAGHVPGALLMPMAQLPGRMSELDPSAPVYVVCATGNRSSAMTDLLRHAGFEAYSLAGGTSGWTRSGRAVVTGHAPRA